MQIDHVNGLRSDNRWCNLRVATQAQNSRNQVRPNMTGFKGVSKKGSRYAASIRRGRTVVHLGIFETAQAAHAAWVRAATAEHGEFIRTA